MHLKYQTIEMLGIKRFIGTYIKYVYCTYFENHGKRDNIL